MLAILSDLHFCDGTANEKNVNPEAFVIALRAIYDEAFKLYKRNQAANKPDPTCHLDLVMLGDIFDLLRTTRWFEETIDGQTVVVEADDRPWGRKEALDGATPPPPVMARAHRILDAILDENKKALATLRGESDDPTIRLPREGITVRRIMLTGNHDRLALHDDALHQKMRDALSSVDVTTLDPSEGIFLHRLEMPQYGLLARHGHEWDLFNFESFRPDKKGADYDDAQYLPAPIGDPITTDLAARLPYEMRRNLARFDVQNHLTQAEKDEIHRRLQRVDDVRPLLASIQWVYQEVARIHACFTDSAKKQVVSDALDESVQKIIAEFKDLEFYKAWHGKHHHFLFPDLAALFDKALDVLSEVSLATVERLAGVFDPLLEHAPTQDDNRTGAGSRGELDHLGRMETKGMRFVVYGHTHDAEQVALSADTEAQNVYLNSGTFRQRVFLTDDRKGFLASDYLSYISLFTEEEAATWRPSQATILPVGPAYITWTGMRNR